MRLGQRNFFNSWGKELNCGINIWVARHLGEHDEETYLSNVYGKRNQLCITSDNTVLMALSPLLPTIHGEPSDTNNSRWESELAFIQKLFQDMCIPHEDVIRKGIPKYAPLVLLDGTMFIDITYLHRLIMHRVSFGPLIGKSQEVADYMEENIVTWHGALKESLVNKSSFYGMDFNRTIKIFELMIPELSAALRQKIKYKETIPDISLISSSPEKPIAILTKEQLKTLSTHFVNANQAGKMLGISHSTVKKRGELGEIQMYTHPFSKKNYFSRADIKAYENSAYGITGSAQ